MGISLRAQVGVDVERVRTLDDADSLVERFFSAREHALYTALEPHDKPVAFFNLWTRKEALLKATGEGIGELLNRVEVSFLKDDAPCFHALPPQFGELEGWQLSTVEPAREFVGAVAVQGRARISCWSWPAEAGGVL